MRVAEGTTGGEDQVVGYHSPAGDSKAEFACGVQQCCRLLQESGHLGTLIHGALDIQEAALEFIHQAHVNHVAERDKRETERHTKHREKQTKVHSLKHGMDNLDGKKSTKSQ